MIIFHKVLQVLNGPSLLRLAELLGQELSPQNYVSLGLLANKGLAYEGLSLWDGALDAYTKSLDTGASLGFSQPYVLNSRGYVHGSLGKTTYTHNLADVHG